MAPKQPRRIKRRAGNSPSRAVYCDMPQNEPPGRWAPRVAPGKIRKLNQTAVLGIVYEEVKI
jgi:hypothetical protein